MLVCVTVTAAVSKLVPSSHELTVLKISKNRNRQTEVHNCGKHASAYRS